MRQTRSDRRGEILNRAAQALAEDPSLSLTELASRSDVGRATLHRHFRSRAELVDAIADAALESSEDLALRAADGSASAGETLERMMRGLVEMGAGYSFLASVPPSDLGADQRMRYERQVATLRELVEQARAERSIGIDLPSRWVARFYEGLIYIAWAALARGDIAANDAAELAVRSFRSGVAPIGAER